MATLISSAQAAMPVALACATVGIVVGVVSTTGLGLKLATGIVGLAGGSLFVTMVLSMVAALVLGTGLPTSATYIITAIMAAPALELLGVPKLVAHFFVFYFGILADLTPPTAISTYATASIAGADVWRTQALGMMLSLSGFIIPFAYVYDPALLLIGASVPQIVVRTAAATLGVIMLSAALIGYLRRRTPAVGAGAPAGRVVPADLPRRLERPRGRGVLRPRPRLPAAPPASGRRPPRLGLDSAAAILRGP